MPYSLPSSRLGFICAIFNVAAVLAFSALADGTDRRNGEDRRIFAEALFSRGLYKQAAVEFARFLEDFPDGSDKARAAFRLGEALRLGGDREGAAKAYRTAAETPGSEFRSKALFKRASIFADLDKHQAADELFAALLADNPPDDVRQLALYYHAKTLEALDRTEEASERLETLLRDYPDSQMSSYARLSLARILASSAPTAPEKKSENLKKAKKLLKDLAENPSNQRLGAEALYLLAFAEKESGNEVAAADAFAKLFSTYPSDMRVADARLAAAWTFCRAERLREAAECAEVALSASPPPAPTLAAEFMFVRAQAAFQLSNYAEAASWFDRTAKAPGVDQQTADKAIYQKALSLFKGGEWAAAATTAEASLSNRDLRADALWLRAEAASRDAETKAAAGDKTGAQTASDVSIESLRQLASEFPDRPSADDVLYRLGEALRLRGAVHDAAIAFGDLAKRHPESPLAPQARFSAASCLAACGLGDEALVQWRTFVRDYPDAAGIDEANYQIGIELLRLGRKTEALQTFTKLSEKPSGTTARLADAMFWRGVILAEDKLFDAAELALRSAIREKPQKNLETDASFALAGVLRESGKADEAVAIYAKLLADPETAPRWSPGLLSWIAAFQCESGNGAAAADTAMRMVKTSGSDQAALQEAWTLVGRSLRLLGKAAEAEKAFDNACRQKASTEFFIEASLRLGEAKLARGDAAGAVPCFGEAAERCDDPKLRPWRVWAYIGLGHAYLALNDLENAAKYLSTVCLLYQDPEVLPPVFDEAIAILRSLGRDEEAHLLAETKVRDYPDKD